MSASHNIIYVLITSLKRLDEHLKFYREQYGAVLAFRPTGELFALLFFLKVFKKTLKILLVRKVKFIFRLDLLREDR